MVADVNASLRVGFDGLTNQVGSIDKRLSDYIRGQDDKYRGVKWMRLPLMQATVTSGTPAISLGEANGQEVGPEEGYLWAIRRLVVAGLASGATPDIVNLWRSSTTQQGGLLWQFNGNNFGYTFGKTEMTLMAGDRLQLVSVGTVTAAVGTQITLSGELNLVPAEMMAKLIL